MKRVRPGNVNGLGAFLLGTTALIGADLWATALNAQEAEPSGTEVIVVTARQREEAIQNVPSQVTAFTAATIEAKQIEMPRDYFTKVPNLHLVETQNIGNAFIIVRGITQARNSEPSVSIIVDGVPQTQPAQFNQALVDVQQIEVIKGPQGALYGRNAIGGAILIKTKQPTDEFEGRITGGYENGPGGKAIGVVSGPLSDNLKVRLATYFFNTSGHIPNTFLGNKQDRVNDVSTHIKFLYEPTDRLTIDVRGGMDRLYTRALYFNMVADVNDVSLPVRVNNRGNNNRFIYDGSVKMDYAADHGTYTSITGYSRLREILTGDTVNFLPIGESFFNFLGTGLACEAPFDGDFVLDPSPLAPPFNLFNDALCLLGSDLISTFDWMQSQYLEVDQWTQEFRFTSPEDRRFRYIFGAQLFFTNRYISTNNIRDDGTLGNTPKVFKTPRFPAEFPTSYNVTFLADSQDQFAWAAYLDTSTSITDELELSLNVRFDKDRRTNTTETPQCFLNSMFGPVVGAGPQCVFNYPAPGPNVPLTFVPIPAFTGQERTETWQAWQPQAILRYQPIEELQLFASYSRGFRSGGFNQTGVGAVAIVNNIAGLADLFDAEKANSYEVGFKSRFLNGRASLNGSLYLTDSKNPYFFFFEVTTSTQNLGNIDKVRYKGFDIELAVSPIDEILLTGGFGYTDSAIKKFGDPSVIGNEAPLVSRTTANVGVQIRIPIGNDVAGVLNVDYSRIGKTWWEIRNFTVRDPVNLVDGRLAIEFRDWTLAVWAKNINNELYNAEFSPSPDAIAPFVGHFVFKALPRRWGIDLTKVF